MSPFWSNGEPLHDVTPAGAPRDAAPSGFERHERLHRVQATSNHWRVHSAWWPEALAQHGTEFETWRDYWEVVTDTGLLCVLYHDLIADAWYLERIYE